MKPHYGFIYITTNLTNGKMYIGQTTKDESVEYFGSGLAISRSIQKHGSNNFIRKIVSYHNSKEELDRAESELIEETGAALSEMYYNISSGGQGGNLGCEVNRRISEAVSGDKNGMYGKTHSDELRNHWSETRRGENHPMYGKSHTEGSRLKISENTKAAMDNPEVKSKISKGISESWESKSEEEKQEIRDMRSRKNKEFWSSDKSELTRKTISDKMSGDKNPFYGKTHNKVECPHCGKVGAEGPMKKQWHFDYCKLNPNRKLRQNEK